jgi:hypothetical protein
MAINVVVSNDDLTVLGPPASIDLQVDIGPEGPRGSYIYSGFNDPNTVSGPFINNPQEIGDLYYRTSNNIIYQYTSQPGGDQWIEITNLEVVANDAQELYDQAEILSASSIYWAAAASGYSEQALTNALSASNLFLSQISASTIYLTQANASSTYLTIAAANSLDTLPDQTGNSGKFLSTTGASAYWETLNSTSGSVDLSSYLTIASASSTYLTQSSASSTYLTQASASANYLIQSDLSSAIQTASAAAYASASAYTISEINALTTNDIPEPSESFTVTNSGTGSYVVAGVNNPTFNLVRGRTYTFVINASGHPFWIQTVSGAYSSGNIYSTGTTNLGTDNGTITWTIPLDSPSTLYYACQYHSSMQGTINIVDPSDNLYFTNQRAISAGSATYMPLNVSLNAQSASYTLQLSDSAKLVELNNASANNLTIPLNSTAAFPIGTQINILQTGAGQTTIVATGGVTINATPGLKLRTQWSSATLIKRASDIWVAIGDLTA